MMNCTVPLTWSEEVLPGDAWRSPHSDWDVEVTLDLLASLSPGFEAEEVGLALLDLIIPTGSLREVHLVQVDVHDGIGRSAGCRIDTELLTWVMNCVWTSSSGTDVLREGRSIARVSLDGADPQAYVCVPLRPGRRVQTLIACRIAAPTEEKVRSLVARLTLLTAVLPVSGDGRPNASRVLASQPPATGGLTRRQRDILGGMAEGLTNRQIAARICFSESTVRLESMVIYRHFGVHSRMEAVAAARRAGMLDESHLSLGA
jgi:DNA-binding CsgD family transcriptional regulator